MTRVKDMAEIKNPNVQGDTLASNAYLLWAAVTSKKSANPTRAYYNGVKGWEYKGSFTDIIYDLWPHLSMSEYKERMKSFRSDIYKYLRQTNNATCISNFANNKTVIWWVSDVWQKQTSNITLVHSLPKHSENKLTPHEAGEDREPSRITVSNEQPSRLSRLIEEHRVYMDLTYEFISQEANNEPITAIEIAAVIDAHSSTGQAIAREMSSTGRLFYRQETMDEREIRFGQRVRATPSRLYSHLNPVPPRTKREVVKGCVAVFNAPKKRQSKKGVLEANIMNAVHTRWQTVEDIATKVGQSTQPNTRSVLKRLVDKGKVEMCLSKQMGTARLVQKYRLPGGVGQTAREAKDVAIVPEVREEVLVGTVETVTVDQAMSIIEDIVLKLTEQNRVPANQDYVNELERQVQLLGAENVHLRAENKKLNDVIAPLRTLLTGG